MKCRLLRDLGCVPTKEFPDGIKPRGTVIDHHDAFRLVQMGVAVPDDNECQNATGMSHAQIKAAEQAYERVSRGIHPEDYAAFDAGLMTGYNPDGSWIPGPNAVEDDDEPPADDDEG